MIEIKKSFLRKCLDEFEGQEKCKEIAIQCGTEEEFSTINDFYKKVGVKGLDLSVWSSEKTCIFVSREERGLMWGNIEYAIGEGNYRIIPAAIIIKKVFNQEDKSSLKNNHMDLRIYAKNIPLSTKEKLLRKHGLKTESGEYNKKFVDLIMDKLCSENEDYVFDLIEKKNKEDKEEVKEIKK